MLVYAIFSLSELISDKTNLCDNARITKIFETAMTKLGTVYANSTRNIFVMRRKHEKTVITFTRPDAYSIPYRMRQKRRQPIRITLSTEDSEAILAAAGITLPDAEVAAGANSVVHVFRMGRSIPELQRGCFCLFRLLVFSGFIQRLNPNLLKLPILQHSRRSGSAHTRSRSTGHYDRRMGFSDGCD